MVEATGDVDFELRLQARADDLAAQGNRRPGLVGLFNGFRAGDAPALRGHRSDQGPDDGGGEAHRRLRRAGRPTWAATMSTTSTASAAPGRSTSRPTAPFRVDAETIRQLKVRNARR